MNDFNVHHDLKNRVEMPSLISGQSGRKYTLMQTTSSMKREKSKTREMRKRTRDSSIASSNA